MASKITPTIEYSNILRYITSTQLSSYLGIFFPNCGGYLAGYIDKNASTRYYYFAAPNLSGGHSPFSIPWFAPGVDQPTLVNLAYTSYTWPGLLNSSITNTTTATGTGFNGQANTTAIYNAGATTAGYAAGFAETLNININGTIFYDYFLGSVYEMDMCYRNIQAFNANAINDERWKLGLYWTSTEFNASYAWFVDYDYESYGGTVDGYLKGSPAWVRALRRFTI